MKRSKHSGSMAKCQTPIDTRLDSKKVGNKFYVSLLYELVNLLPIEMDPVVINDLRDLPLAVKVYEDAADLARAQDNVSLYFARSQAASLLKKLELPLFEEIANENALVEWYASEEACKTMNEKLFQIYRNPLTHPHVVLAEVLNEIRSEISSLLGEEAPDLDEVSQFMKFGPGASITHKKDRGDAVFKIFDPSAYKGMELEVAWLYKNTLLGESVPLGYFGCSAGSENLKVAKAITEYVDYNVIAMVPKAVDKMRPIAVEPSLAMFIQQGYDGVLRKRLLHWGLDLSDQSPNRDLAFKGSIPSECPTRPCTIDLKSASDRISSGLVYSLLPKTWFDALLPLRAPLTKIGDTYVKLEKFSSMGNAITFSLQTLIFAAVVRSVLKTSGHGECRWRVYGDDIIVPFLAYDKIVTRLEMLGFTVNSRKSFSDGNFRESCGGDYFHGTNVRPLYLSKPLKTVRDVYRVLNLVQSIAERAPIPGRCYGGLYRLLLSLVPKELQIFGEPHVELDNWIWSPLAGIPAKFLKPVAIKHQVPKKQWYYRCLLVGGYESRVMFKNERDSGSARTVSIRDDISPFCHLRRPRLVGGRPLQAPVRLTFTPEIMEF